MLSVAQNMTAHNNNSHKNNTKHSAPPLKVSLARWLQITLPEATHLGHTTGTRLEAAAGLS